MKWMPAYTWSLRLCCTLLIARVPALQQPQSRCLSAAATPLRASVLPCCHVSAAFAWPAQAFSAESTSNPQQTLLAHLMTPSQSTPQHPCATHAAWSQACCRPSPLLRTRQCCRQHSCWRLEQRQHRSGRPAERHLGHAPDCQPDAHPEGHRGVPGWGGQRHRPQQPGRAAAPGTAFWRLDFLLSRQDLAMQVVWPWHARLPNPVAPAGLSDAH